MRPGEVIDGKYQIEAELGEGGMGRVLAASHLALGNAVAIKVLKSEALRLPDVPRRFMREARAAGRLRNEHVVRVTDVGVLPTGEPYMVMEMLHGIDLATMLEQGPLPPQAAAEYLVQACEGLAEAHAMGMVHRDIKPANLFVTRRSNGSALVKLLDFGIATAAIGDIDHKLTTTAAVIGSPSYMSPEQLRAARDVDARSDIWSLGVTLYELLSGEQPFLAPTITALTLKIVAEPHVPLRNVPPALAAIVDRCLAKQREERFASVAELATALAPLFPNGHAHAEIVASVLGGPVAPLRGVDSSSVLALAPRPSSPAGPGFAAVPRPSRPASAGLAAAATAAAPRAATPVPWEPPQTSTADLTAGESAPMRPAARRRAVWIMLGAALAGAIVTFGIVLSQRSTSSAAAPAAAAAPPAAEEAVAPPPPPVPAPAPAEQVAPPTPAPAPAAPEPPAPAAEPPDMPPEPPEPAPEPAPAKPSAKPLAKSPARRAPVKRTTTRPEVKQPARDPRGPLEPDYTKPTVKDPAKDPVKKPCAPNDPTCGL